MSNSQSKRSLIVIVLIGLIYLSLYLHRRYEQRSPIKLPFSRLYGTQPLVMSGGDPYIRALMRTISASESNDAQPYTLIYGGDRVSDLSNHPNVCVTIMAGPNKGNCSTAAGRYQFINTTWDEKAKRYHPKPSDFMLWKSYSFEPEYQDAVVYAWLSDRQAWGVDISQLLRDGKIDQVLRRLSGTWTSLGYGIESNSMTRRLPRIYKQMLKDELKTASPQERQKAGK